MTTQPLDPLTERMSRLEVAYQHLATKADQAELKAELKTELVCLEVRMAEMEVRLVRWTVGAIIGASAFATVIVQLIP